MRVTIANPVWDPAALTPADMLARFSTLTGWAAALRRAGADVTVVQRSRADANISADGVRYVCVDDGGAPAPRRWTRAPARLARAMAATAPDIVHVNGIHTPEWVRSLRAALPGRTALVVQDHGGFDPERASWNARAWIRRGVRAADAVLVTSSGQVAQFVARGLVPPGVEIADVMESSTTLERMPKAEARTRLAIDGDPLVVWVGRLTAAKDPLTVLRGFSGWLRAHPRALMAMLFQGGEWESAVRAMIAADVRLRDRVLLVGRVPHPRVAAYLSAADLFIAGSRHEGSGYALIEALACGAVPVVTDIPSFRALTDDGRVGALWQVGRAEALTAALDRALQASICEQSAAARALFDARFTWRAIGARAHEIYARAIARRQRRRE